MQSKKQFDEAINLCRRALQIQPNNPDAYNNMGNALQEKGDAEKAVACFRKALEFQPNHVDAMNNLANCFQEQGKLEDSIALYRKAIELRPLFAKAHGNLGNALRALGRIDESIATCRKAVEMMPTMEEAHVNLGTAPHMAGRYTEGVASCHRAIELRSDFAEVHKDLSLMLLVQGKFEEGWREYEWRLRLPHYFNSPTRFAQPMWDGSDLRGRKILIHAEQGLGDTIHFARFLPLLQKRGGKVILECQAELVRLMKQMEILKGVEVLPCESKSGPKVEFDVHAALLSLPLLLNRLAPTDQLDVAQPPYIKADAYLQDQWRARLADSTGLKIGLAWAGSPTNKNDRHRSITLPAMAPLARDGVEFYSLQFGKPAEQTANPPRGMKLIDHTAKIGDFADTAAMVAELDLIICIDTALGHLAGAMNKPVWVMLQFTPDFRWLLEGRTTPWYPSMRLFRQKKFGDWAEVIEEVAGELGNAMRRDEIREGRQPSTFALRFHCLARAAMACACRGPVVKRRRVKISAVGPNQGVDLGIDSHLIENVQVAQRSEKLSGENWLEIDDLLHVIVESNPQDVRRFDLECSDAVDGVCCHIGLIVIESQSNGLIGSGA